MYAVGRTQLTRASAVVLLLALAAGCGSSLTAVRPRTSTPSATPTPFCEAVQQSRTASTAVNRSGTSRQVPDIAAVADRLRAANLQVTSLAPQELRGDFDRLTEVLDRQLRVLETNGGDTLALSRDPDLVSAVTDPAYTAAQRRVDDYVRRTC